QEAIVFEQHRLSYVEVESRVRRLAGGLAGLGGGRGTRGGAPDTNSHRYIEGDYASALPGGGLNPGHYRAKQPELLHMLRAGEASVLLVGMRYLPAVQALRADLPALRTLIVFDGPSGDAPGFDALVSTTAALDGEAEVDDDDTTILMF